MGTNKKKHTDDTDWIDKHGFLELMQVVEENRPYTDWIDKHGFLELMQVVEENRPYLSGIL